MDIKEEEILGSSIHGHWYYEAKADAIVRALADIDPTTALDVGSGSGFFARALLARTAITSVDCVDTAYEAASDEVAPGGALRFRTTLDRAGHGIDLAVLMDVLEHVDDDVGLLKETTERLSPDGRVLLTVPAFDFLWSSHDEFLGHVRRYTLASALDLVARSGLIVERSHYLYGLVFPAALVQRLVDRGQGSKLQEHHPVVNRALFALCQIEGPVQRFNRLAGLTVLIRARRP